MKEMNRTTIPWVKNPDGSQGYTWNPLTGCLNHVDGLCKGGGFPCYAYRLAHGRLKTRYLENKNLAHDYLEIKKAFDRGPEPFQDPFYPRFWPEKVKNMDIFGKKKTYAINIRKPKGIFVCDMGELFGDWVPEYWQKSIFLAIKSNSQHRFYILTKQPQNLVNFSPFPPHCWVGVTTTDRHFANQAQKYMLKVEAKIKYLSIEPCFDSIPWELLLGYNWLIIGSCTGTKKDMEKLIEHYPDLTLMPWGKKWTAQPKIEWVREIIEAADKARIPVFLKDNLKPLLASEFNGKTVIESHNLWAFRQFKLRQEMPE